MTFTVIYDPRVQKEDLPKIPEQNKAQIAKAIHERLAIAPLSFGKPLRHSLSGMRSLRVGDWRIGYYVEGRNVVIEHIEIRRDAYKGW